MTEGLRPALWSDPRPPRASALADAFTFGWQRMLKIKHVPEQLTDVTLSMPLMVLMFTYLFGGAVAGSPEAYLDYILPGSLAITVLMTTVYSGVSLNTDLTKGVVDRFRSLPIWQPAPLVGGILGDIVRYFLGGTIIMLLGLALGYRPAAGLVGVVLALALVITFACAMSWVFMAVGLVLRSPSAVFNVGFTAIFPLLFVSNVLVDPATLPSWMEAVVNVNPVSFLAAATRGLMEGNADPRDIVIVVLTAAALTAVFAPLTSRLYRTRG